MADTAPVPPLTLSPQQLAAALLGIGAFKLRPDQPFKWASGWHSPVYCDNRQTLSYPTLRTQICNGLVALAHSHFAQAKAVAGVATAGIAQGALVADRLDLPFAYVRSKPKGHGMQNLIEGTLPEGVPILIVEDLVSTGSSSFAAIQALRTQGHVVAGLVCIFDYGFPQSAQLFAENDVPVQSLTNLEALIAAGVQTGALATDQIATLRKWQAQPDAWHSALSS